MRTFNSIAVDGRDCAALQTLSVGSKRWRSVGDRSIVACVRDRKCESRLRVELDRLDEMAHAAFDLSNVSKVVWC